MSQPDPVLALSSALRARIEESANGEGFDTAAALTELARLEKASSLLRRVSLHSYDAFEQRINELSLVSSIGRIFISIFDLKRMCDALLELVMEALPCENAFFYLSDSVRGLDLQSVAGPEPDAVGLEIAEAIGFLAVNDSEPLCVPDVYTDSRFQRFTATHRARSLLACPVEAMGELLGAIVVSESSADALTADRTRILGPVADLAALAVRHARVCARNLEHQHDLEALIEQRTHEVNEVRAALSRQERTSAMGKLAASIAHEVNNPMSYLASNIERALDYAREIEAAVPHLLELEGLALELSDRDAPEVARVKEAALRAIQSSAPERLTEICSDFGELLGETREGVNRIKRVGDDLRGFAQGITGTMEPVDFNRLVETALHIAKADHKEQVRFDFRPAVLPDVLCQKYPITQVLVNLIKNAAESIEGEGEVKIYTRALGDWVEVEIADDGTGIPPDQIDRIFEPFLTTKLSGSGLGLSISRDIVRAHCGSLDVRSSPEGSVFSVRLSVAGPNRANHAPR